MAEGLSTLDHKLMISGLFKRCVAPTTYEIFWRVIVWSLVAGMSGYHPEEDWNGGDVLPESLKANAGKVLAGGLFFVIWSIKANDRSEVQRWYLR